MQELLGAQLSEKAEFMIDNLDLEEASGVEGARWEWFQLQYLNCESMFMIAVKSRQIAFSWIMAAEAVANAILRKEDTVFVSINQDEASEKIVYAKRIYNSLQVGGLPKIKRDSLTDLEFDNGARLTSLTGRAPRGRSRAHVRLDEFCFVQNDRRIYGATLPIISKGNTTLRIASSPWGQDGLFYEIYSEILRPYSGYTRLSIPWWEVYAFCTNVKQARLLAPGMATVERVERYGNPRIKMIYENMLIEDFGQEFECNFQGSGDSWLEFDDIKKVQSNDLHFRRVKCRGKTISQSIELIDRLLGDIRAGKIENVLAVGIDIGRKKDTTEIFILGLTSIGVMPLRAIISLSNVEFEYQEMIILHILRVLPIARMLIDQTGLGRNLAENMIKLFPIKVAGVNFSQAIKQMLATDLKKLVQTARIRIPADRDLAYQLHSVKRVVSGTLLKFDVVDDGSTTGGKGHHGDMFWALALSSAAAKQFVFMGSSNSVGESLVHYW